MMQQGLLFRKDCVLIFVLFVKPSEMSGYLRGAGLELSDITGVAYNPINDTWSPAPRDLDVNYMVIAQKPD